MRIVRFVTLLAALALAMTTTPASASAAGQQSPNGLTVALAYTDTFHVTFDWAARNDGLNPVNLPPRAPSWTINTGHLPQPVKDAYAVSTGTDGAVTISFAQGLKDAAGYPLPEIFEFTFTNPENPSEVYLVGVTTTNIPAPVAPAATHDIVVPTVVAATVTDDLGELWDSGDPRAVGGGGYVSIPVASTDEYVVGATGEVVINVVPLNAQMGMYFTATARPAHGDIRLDRVPSSPPLPPRYWERNWFVLGYTLSGVQTGPTHPELSRTWSSDRTVRFAEPAWSLTAANRKARAVGTRAQGVRETAALSISGAYGLVGNSLKVELGSLPKSVTKKFKVSVRNPARLRPGSFPTISVTPKTAKSPKSVKVPFRFAALNRAGELVYTATHTVAFRG